MALGIVFRMFCVEISAELPGTLNQCLSTIIILWTGKISKLSTTELYMHTGTLNFCLNEHNRFLRIFFFHYFRLSLN
jgi:hypothetical protein